MKGQMVGRTARSVALAAAVCSMPAALPGSAAAATTSRATPGASGVGDRVFPGLGNGGYDVQAYSLDVVYAREQRIDGLLVMTARATQELSRFNLDSYGLDISSVTVDGVRAAFSQRGHELVVTPRRALRSGFDFSAAVRYATHPRRVPQPLGGFVPTPDGFATAARQAGAHTVFPCNDHPSDKAPLTVRITTPGDLMGVANGRLARTVTNPDLTVTATYQTAEPVSTGAVQLSVGRYSVLDHGLQQATRLRDVAPTVRLPGLLPALALTPGQIAWARDRFGSFPLEAYGILVLDTDSPTAFGPSGLATETLTLYEPGFLARTEEEIGPHMMRQLVHGWFGHSVTPKDWSSLWLADGHAELYGLLYQFDRGWTDADGNRTLEQHMRSLYARGDAWRRAGGPVARPGAANLMHPQRSSGAALALYALLVKVGPEAFTDIERAFVTRYRDNSAGTAEFVDLVEEITSDTGVRSYLEGWLYGTRTPTIPTHGDWRVDPLTD